MDEKLKFDYYYGIEAEQFSFYRVPRILIKDKRFKELSSDAKLLYGLMLDRMALSMKNGWFDSENRAYIIYAIESIVEDLNCGRDKAIKVLAELDASKGIGLIERVRRGLGKPDIIYVKNFVGIKEDSLYGEKEDHEEQIPEDLEETDSKESEKPTSRGRENRLQEVDKIAVESTEMADFTAGNGSNEGNNERFGLMEAEKADFKKSEKPTSRGRESRLQEVEKTDFKKSEKSTSRSRKIELQEVGKTDSNYNNINYNENSYNNLIYQSWENSADMTDEMDKINAYMQIIRENIEYDYYVNHAQKHVRELAEELYQLICDVVCVKRTSIRIGGEDYPYELVKAKFLKLNQGHIEYVMERMKNTTSKIGNIRSYLITTLYNAPNTMNYYYQQEVQHDLYGRYGYGMAEQAL